MMGVGRGKSMSECMGELPVTSKVDRDMLDYVDDEAARFGVNRAEFLRRLLEDYRESRRENLDCPNCGEAVVFDLRK